MNIKDYIIGLPINKDTSTEEFQNFIDSDEPTVMIMTAAFVGEISNSQEYKSCSYGFDALRSVDYGYILYKNIDLTHLQYFKKVIIMLDDVWHNTDGTRTHPYDVGRRVLEMVQQIRSINKDIRIARICPGNPYIYDHVNTYLLQYWPLVKVINSKSSLQLAFEELEKNNLTKGFPINLVNTNFKDGDFKIKSVNIIGSIGYVYKNNELLQKLIDVINDTDLIYTIQLGEVNNITQITPDDLYKLYYPTKEYRPTTLAIIKH